MPPLAVEIADRGQDENDLQVKIAEFLAAGTQVIWVVRLQPPRHVEVHRPGKSMVRAGVGELLSAPGILKNPIPVEALWDRDVAHDITFQNLLERRGIESLDRIRDEAREEGRQEGDEHATRRLLDTARATLRRAIAGQGLPLSVHADAAISSCADLATLMNWSMAIASGAIPDALAPGA